MAQSKDRHREYMREWRHANRDRANAIAQASRERNREALRARDREYYRQNRDQMIAAASVRVRNRNRRNIIAGLPSGLHEMRLVLYEFRGKRWREARRGKAA